MLQSPSAGEGREIREFLRDAGYTIQTLKSRFENTVIPHIHLLKLYLNGIALEPSRVNLLIRWFWIGSPVEVPAARELIPERILELFLRCGVLTENDGFLTSAVRISPFNDLLILSDHAVSPAGPLRNDAVLWPNPTTRLCYNFAMQNPVERTLDLGTGTGVLALAAASHSGRVVATDLNPRAREFCQFNAALHGITNVEFREGNAFQPVRGERFDLILANPPFFVTPSVRRVFSDNDMELDGFCRSLIRQAPEYLTEKGYCQMLLEWVQLKGQPWRDRISEWVAGLGCDVWVIVTSMKPSIDYALRRVQEDCDEGTQTADRAALTQSWQNYFESKQVEAIYGGLIVMRRREGSSRVRMEEWLSVPGRPFGEFVRRMFESRDALESCSDEELLQARPRLAASARLKQQFARSSEGWTLAGIHLQSGEGLPYSLALQPQVAEFLASCNGGRTLGELADEMAAALSVDPVMVRRESCGIIRQAMDRGMMLI